MQVQAVVSGVSGKRTNFGMHSGLLGRSWKPDCFTIYNNPFPYFLVSILSRVSWTSWMQTWNTPSERRAE